jgi:hypothetical protein
MDMFKLPQPVKVELLSWSEADRRFGNQTSQQAFLNGAEMDVKPSFWTFLDGSQALIAARGPSSVYDICVPPSALMVGDGSHWVPCEYSPF